MIEPYKVLVTDVDGVLTSGSFTYNTSGKIFKEFGAHDSDAIKMFQKFGVEIIAISADKRGFEITRSRLNDMNVEINYVSEDERYSWIQKRFASKIIAFVGDGYSDIKSFRLAQDSYAPCSAPKVVKDQADKVLTSRGGEGVLLEIFEHFIEQYHPDQKEVYLKGEILING